MVFLSKTINVIFSVWIGVILFGAVRSPHLDITGISPELFTLIILIVVGMLLYLLCNPIKLFVNDRIISKIGKHKFSILLTLSLLLLMGQLFFLANTTTVIGFDAGGIVGEVLHGTAQPNYFSYNPNNLPLLFLEYFWGDHFGMNWFSFNALSLVSTDLGFVITVLSARYINKKIMYSTWGLSLIILSCFPYIIVPYTDTLVLPWVNLTLLGYLIIKKSNHFYQKAVGSIMMGIFGVAAYLLKPSSIIFIIAIIIIELAYLFFNCKKVKVLYSISILCMICISAFTIHKLYNNYLTKQSYVKIYPSMKKPPVLFLAMGMVGGGGYNSKLTDTVNMLPTQRAKKDYAIDQIKNTLQSYGPAGYLQFLIKKNFNNTSDGSFGWLQEGNFISATAKNQFQQVVYPDGKYLSDYYFISQIVWIFLLIILFKKGQSTKELTPFLLILELSIIGSLMYLLLFEGGRSRYLIQFLPQFIILAGVYLSLNCYNKQKFSYKNIQ